MSTLLAFIVNLAGITAIAWWIYSKQPVAIRKFFWPALVIKLLAGTAVGFLYALYYKSGDTLTFWYDGNLIAESLLSDPLDALKFFWNDDTGTHLVGLFNDKPRSIFFVKIAGILSLLSYGNYWIMAAILSFLSFLGAWYLFAKIVKFVADSRVSGAIAFLFFPSVVFWSSGLIKESLGLGALFFLAGSVLTILSHERLRPWEWVTAFLSVWIAWQLKYYWVGIFAPVCMATIITDQLTQRRPGLVRAEIGIWTCIFIIIISLGTAAHPNFYPERVLEVIVENNTEFMRLTAPVNAVHYHDLDATVASMLRNAPQALLAGLFRPFIWETHNALSVVAGIENLALIILVITSSRRLKLVLHSRWRLTTFAVMVCIVLMAVFLALSTPNLGTLSRYKIGFIPFLVFLATHGNPVTNRLDGKLN